MTPNEFMKLMHSGGSANITIIGDCTFSCLITNSEIIHNTDSRWVTKYVFDAVVSEMPTGLFITSREAEIEMPPPYHNVKCYLDTVSTPMDEINITTIDGGYITMPAPMKRIEIQFRVYADDLDDVIKQIIKIPYNRFDILDFGDDYNE